MASTLWRNLTADGPELFDMSVFLSGIVRSACSRSTATDRYEGRHGSSVAPTRGTPLVIELSTVPDHVDDEVGRAGRAATLIRPAASTLT